MRFINEQMGKFKKYMHYDILEIFYLIKKKRRCASWFRIKGDKTLRLNYRLDSNSLVFDVGGYKGEWSEEIIKKYDCHIFIFEPVPEYYEIIRQKFENNHKIHAFNLALGSSDKRSKIGILKDSSSAYKISDDQIEICSADIVDFLNKNNINKIDLMKINIEGGEYELLEHLINNNLINRIQNIQVQFHDFLPNAKQRMNLIQKNLEMTHHLTYCYPFVWESWEINKQ